MTSVAFIAQTSPVPHIGQMMRAADLCEGVVVSGDFLRVIVTWKNGEVVDEARKSLAKKTIKRSLEELGYDCYSVAETEKGGPK